MQDILKKYSKHKLISNLGLITMSLIVASGINFLLIDGTQTGQNLKADILGSGNAGEIVSDIYFDNIDSKISIKTSKKIENAKSISLSLIYNPENVQISNIVSTNNQVSTIENDSGIKSIIINLSNIENIKKDEKIIEFEAFKKDKITENINIVNANFTDSNGKIFLLSTSGLSF